MTFFYAREWVLARVMGAIVIAGSLPGLASASTGILKASQTMVLHSLTGIGCQDISVIAEGGSARPGSCVEIQINVKNLCDTNTAKAIDFSNSVDKGLIFIAANVDGFAGATVKMPNINTDCGEEDCLVTITGASLEPERSGILKIRAILK